jgi:hypothetical protein
MPEKIICSAKELKGKERRGTMLECAEKKQIKYYGLKKVDKILLEKILNKTKEKITYSLPEAIGKITGLRTRIKNTEKSLEIAKKKNDKVKIKDLEKIIEDAQKEVKKMLEIGKKLQEEQAKEEQKKSKKTPKKK